jgi:uncharacterized membrane protein YfcA
MVLHQVAFDPLYALSGLLVGLLVGLTGVGGGSLMTPLLVLLFGIHPATAVGTDLLYASVTKSVGTAVHGFSRNVEWRIVRRLAAGSVPATLLVLAVFYSGGPQRLPSSHVISCVLGVAVMLTAALLLARGWVIRRLVPRLGPDGPRHATALTVLTGAILGTLVTISSVGSGALGVTALVLLYPRLPTARIVGSDIAHAVPLTLLAGLGHWWIGSVDAHLLLSLLSGSIPGIIIGSLIAVRVPDGVIRPALATVLILVGGRLVF